ncbi:MAG: UDP-N-acetylmuramoyl-L-alanyl-D-glutamate--2,6-diaminopimelate ligase [Acidimicrobiales bacterium]
MRLDQLLDGIDPQAVAGDVTGIDVTAITHDSRDVGPGALFCCVPGERFDGHDFAPDAVAAGAVALVVERVIAADIVGAVAQVVVPSTRAAMGPLAAALFGHPSHSLDVVGVTGTNGKTTTVHLLQSILAAAGRPTIVIGTLTGTRTTPEAPQLQGHLASFRDGGGRAVAMEVSSHALALHRVDGTRFKVAVFTNLGRDHLDFHVTMSDYFQAKARLFDPSFSDTAVVNLDDSYGRLLNDAARVPTVGYSLAQADYLDVRADRSQFRWRGVQLEVRLGGRFNASNALAAATAASQLDIDPAAVAEGLRAAEAVPGRFESVDESQPFRVIVDYAHTPDGLDQLLTAAREVAADHRVHVVFGAGGDRDPTKRPAMGEVAARLADRVVLTSDNPRGEEPRAIIQAVQTGISDLSRVVVEPDRRAAIALVLGDARPGDVVVIAGKGHETTQTIGDDVLPFDDREVARDLLRSRSW